MRVYKTVEKREKVQRLEERRCDLCSADLRVSDPSDLDDVTIENERGYRYPEGSDTTTTRFDLCGKCFREKLAPWFAERGAKPSETRSEW